MSNLLQVCVYNTDPEASKELEAAIRELHFVRLVAEVSTPTDLAAALQEADIKLVFFHLDPAPTAVVDVISQLSTRHPEVGLVAISHRTDPQAILAPIRAGCDQFVCKPIDPEDLASAVAQVSSKRLLSRARSRCICVTAASGGAGATSIACNLALEIGHLTNRNCALVDLDLQFGDVALNFDCEPKYTLHDLAVAGADVDHASLSSVLTTLPCNVAILTRPEMIEQQEQVTPDTIQRVLGLLMAGYENTVIDVPHHFDACTAAAFAQSEVIFIVCQLLVPSIRNVKRYYDALRQIGVPEEHVEVVVNRDAGRDGRLTVKDVEDAVKKPVYACIPNDYQFVARSIDLGRPIAALDRDSPVRTAIRKMARDITSEPDSETPTKDVRRGFLSRFLVK